MKVGTRNKNVTEKTQGFTNENGTRGDEAGPWELGMIGVLVQG